MSSTNRGAVRSEGDFYRTPAWCVEAVLERIPFPLLGARMNILDPGCGDGALGEVLRQRLPKAHIMGLDINNKLILRASEANVYDTIDRLDFLKDEPEELLEALTFWPDLIFANPPYNLSLEFVKRAFQLVRTGEVVFLLRLSWLASKKRQALHRKYPSTVFVLPRRPSFCWSHTYKLTCPNGCYTKKRPFEIKESVPVGERAKTRAEFHVPCPNPLGTGCDAELVFDKSTTVTSDSCDYAWFRWRFENGRIVGGGDWEIL